MKWPKYWSFRFSISPSNEHPGPMSFRMDWLDLLALQGTLKSLLQHHSSKASIFQDSAFFTVHHIHTSSSSHPYMTIGKTIALTRWTLVGKVMLQKCAFYHMAIWPRPERVCGFAALTSQTVLATRTPVDILTLEGVEK